MGLSTAGGEIAFCRGFAESAPERCSVLVRCWATGNGSWNIAGSCRVSTNNLRIGVSSKVSPGVKMKTWAVQHVAVVVHILGKHEYRFEIPVLEQLSHVLILLWSVLHGTFQEDAAVAEPENPPPETAAEPVAEEALPVEVPDPEDSKPAAQLVLQNRGLVGVNGIMYIYIYIYVYMYM